MITVSRSKKQIKKILDRENIDLDLEGLLIQRDDRGDNLEMVTSRAPVGEPSHYNPKTNTGGRRFICWV